MVRKYAYKFLTNKEFAIRYCQQTPEIQWDLCFGCRWEI